MYESDTAVVTRYNATLTADGGVTLVHRGNSLFFVRKIKFQRVLIVAGFTVDIQNAGGIVTAIGVLGKLVSLAQQRYTVHFEPGTAQLNGRGGLTGGGHQLLQTEPGFQYFVLRLIFSADNVSGFICISKGLIVVDFIRTAFPALSITPRSPIPAATPSGIPPCLMAAEATR